MSNTELLNKINLLSPEDYNMIVLLVDRLEQNSHAFPKLSEDELVEELSHSIEKSNNGHTRPARQISREMREKYAV